VRGTGKDAAAGGGLGHPIELEGCAVRTGDIVVADRDGIVVIAADELESIAARARGRDQSEDGIVARLRAGETTLAIYGLP
jgi:4-hydroxy-4-methyl-2-oxoglutarate aldolase